MRLNKNDEIKVYDRLVLAIQLIVALVLTVYFVNGVTVVSGAMINPDPRNPGGWNDYAYMFLLLTFGLLILSAFWLFKVVRRVLN